MLILTILGLVIGVVGGIWAVKTSMRSRQDMAEIKTAIANIPDDLRRYLKDELPNDVYTTYQPSIEDAITTTMGSLSEYPILNIPWVEGEDKYNPLYPKTKNAPTAHNAKGRNLQRFRKDSVTKKP